MNNPPRSDDLILIAVLAGQVAASSDDILPRLRRLALKAITVIGGAYGNPRSVRLANHCVEAIAAAALPSSVTELIETERGTRHGSLLRQVRKSVVALAAVRGLTRDELLETAVEDHGLSPDGTRRADLPGAWLAVIEADVRTARLSYEDPDGHPRKSLPPAIKQASAGALAAISKDLKAIRTTIGNERARLDACAGGAPRPAPPPAGPAPQTPPRPTAPPPPHPQRPPELASSPSFRK